MSFGLRMEEMVFNLADAHLFFNDLEVSFNLYWIKKKRLNRIPKLRERTVLHHCR